MHLAEIWRCFEKNDRGQLVYFQTRDGVWQSESIQELLTKAKYLTLALLKRGLREGEPVGILCSPCSRWMIAELAVVLAGGAIVSVVGLSKEEFIYQVERVKVKTLFVAGTKEWLKYKEGSYLFSTILALEHNYLYQNAITLQRLIELGKKEEEKKPHLWRQILAKSAPIAAHPLTSLTQKLFSPSPKKERYLSFLPLPAIHLMSYEILLSGQSIFYVENPKQLIQACRQVKPTTLALSSCFLKQFKEEITAQMSRKWIGRWAVQLARSSQKGFWINCKRSVADRMIYRGFRKIFGGHVRSIFSESVLSAELQTFFANIGFSVLDI